MSAFTDLAVAAMYQTADILLKPHRSRAVDIALRSPAMQKTYLYIVIFRYKVRRIAIYRYMQIENDMPIDLDEIIKALAHPIRRQILAWLKDPQACFPDQDHWREHGVCAGQIDQRARLSQSTVSAHLATLQRAGLITSKKYGQWHFFKRNEDVIQAFLLELTKQL